MWVVEWGKECMDKYFSNLTHEIEELQIGDHFSMDMFGKICLLN